MKTPSLCLVEGGNGARGGREGRQEVEESRVSERLFFLPQGQKGVAKLPSFNSTFIQAHLSQSTSMPFHLQPQVLLNDTVHKVSRRKLCHTRVCEDTSALTGKGVVTVRQASCVTGSIQTLHMQRALEASKKPDQRVSRKTSAFSQNIYLEWPVETRKEKLQRRLW